MLRHAEGRLRQIAAGHPDDGLKYLQAGGLSTETWLIGLLEREGYQSARYFFRMPRDLAEPFPEAPMPPGLEVRPVPPEHYRTVFYALLEAFKDNWGAVPLTEDQFQQYIELPTFQPELWRVAWEGDQVAGMVLSYVDREENEEYGRRRGYTDPIGVRLPWHRRGLARSLLVQSMETLRAMGMTETALGVDTQNLSGALRLYESVGYRPFQEGRLYRKPLEGEKGETP